MSCDIDNIRYGISQDGSTNLDGMKLTTDSRRGCPLFKILVENMI